MQPGPSLGAVILLRFERREIKQKIIIYFLGMSKKAIGKKFLRPHIQNSNDSPGPGYATSVY